MLHIGKLIIVSGILLIVIGAIVIVLDRLGVHIGKLPGDIVYRKGNTTFYFPIVTSVLLSILLSLIIWVFRK